VTGPPIAALIKAAKSRGQAFSDVLCTVTRRAPGAALTRAINNIPQPSGTDWQTHSRPGGCVGLLRGLKQQQLLLEDHTLVGAAARQSRRSPAREISSSSPHGIYSGTCPLAVSRGCGKAEAIHHPFPTLPACPLTLDDSSLRAIAGLSTTPLLLQHQQS
jgi:hypothetical protein